RHARRSVRVAAGDARLAGTAWDRGAAGPRRSEGARVRRRRRGARPPRRRTRLRVRQRTAPGDRARRVVRDRFGTGPQSRVRPLRRRRRLRRRRALARRRRRVARAARPRAPVALAKHGRRLADALVRPMAAPRPRGAGDPRQRVGGRGVLPVRRATAAERSRMGARSARRALPLGRKRLGVDRRRVPALSRVRRRAVRRLLGAVVRRSSRAARRRVRDARAHARSALPQFLRRRPQRRLRRIPHRHVGALSTTTRETETMTALRPFLATLAVVAAALAPLQSHAQNVLRVSAIPDEAPTELQRKFKPLGDYLKQETGMDVQFIPVTDYAAVVEGLATNKLDLAWLGGFTYVQARLRTNGGVVPIVQRAEDAKFTSRFIVPVNSTAKTLADLKGKTFAF